LVSFVAVILRVLIVNLIAALNFANVFLKIKKNVWKIKKTLKNVKNVTKKNKRKKRFNIRANNRSEQNI